MILVDVYVPSVNREYDFNVNEHAAVGEIIDEIASMVAQKEQSDLKGHSDELVLCNMDMQMILHPDKTLAEAGVITGNRLILV